MQRALKKTDMRSLALNMFSHKQCSVIAMTVQSDKAARVAG